MAGGWLLRTDAAACLGAGNVRPFPRGPAQPVNDQRYGNKHDDTQQHEQDIAGYSEALRTLGE